MKALSIHQPYAHLIALPDDDDRAKRVENRKWATRFQGELAIHASKTRERLELDEHGVDELYEIPVADMAFGAVVAVCRIVECFPFTRESGTPRATLFRHHWLAGHPHVEGPFCFVLTEVRALAKPIPTRGAQGFFDLPESVVTEIREQFKTPI